MSSSVTHTYLLEGASYALEQCGLLLRDANILFRGGSFSSTVVLAAFAREELGRSTILFDLRRAILAGKSFPLEQIKALCKDHETKQKKGMLSTALSGDNPSGVGKLLSAMGSDPQSMEWQEANSTLDQMVESKRKRTPNARHQIRMSALYVQPESQTQWNRPATTSARFAQTFLRDAVNNYSSRYHQRYIVPAGPILKSIDPELHSALEQWSGRPTLPPPEWPMQIHEQ